MQNILFENVSVELSRWSKWPGARYDRRPCPTHGANDPESGFLHHPTAAFLLNNAQQVTLRNCEVHVNDFPAAELGAPLDDILVQTLAVDGFGEYCSPI